MLRGRVPAILETFRHFNCLEMKTRDAISGNQKQKTENIGSADVGHSPSIFVSALSARLHECPQNEGKTN